LNSGVLITLTLELQLGVAGAITGSAPSPERVVDGQYSAAEWLATLFVFVVFLGTNGGYQDQEH